MSLVQPAPGVLRHSKLVLQSRKVRTCVCIDSWRLLLSLEIASKSCNNGSFGLLRTIPIGVLTEGETVCVLVTKVENLIIGRTSLVFMLVHLFFWRDVEPSVREVTSVVDES